jgi:hypothetical protein
VTTQQICQAIPGAAIVANTVGSAFMFAGLMLVIFMSSLMLVVTARRLWRDS